MQNDPFKLKLAPGATFSKRASDRVGAMRKLVKPAPTLTFCQKLAAIWNYDTRGACHAK